MGYHRGFGRKGESDMPDATAQDRANDLDTIPGTRMKVDWAKLVSSQDIVLETSPADTLNGLRLGNGDIGVSVFGTPELTTLNVGKNDILDYRAKYSDEDWRVRDKVPTPSGKPAGSIRFRTASQRGSEYLWRLGLWDAEVTGHLGEAEPATVRTFVSYPRNIVVAEYSRSGELTLDIELARNQDSTGLIPNPPAFGATGCDLWVRYKFPADELNYPDGFEYVMYGRVIGGEIVNSGTDTAFATVTQSFGWEGPGRQALEGISVARVRASEPVTLLVALATTREDADPFTRARAILDEAESAGLDELRREHRDHWHHFWQRSFVQLPENRFLTQHWFVNQYHLACCWREGRIAPGMFGPWIWQDFPKWGNDYHWDYNMQQPIWGAYSSNHLEQTVAYNETAAALLPVARTRAMEFEGTDGALFPTI